MGFPQVLTYHLEQNWTEPNWTEPNCGLRKKEHPQNKQTHKQSIPQNKQTNKQSNNLQDGQAT